MSRLTEILIFVAVSAAILFAALIYLGRREHAAEQRGVDRQVAADIAKANQNIATRRETDAHFDSHDARALCADYGLDWVFEDGKSFCR